MLGEEPLVVAADGGFGAKFEELLVVGQDRAYWLDDISQQRITIDRPGGGR